MCVCVCVCVCVRERERERERERSGWREEKKRRGRNGYTHTFVCSWFCSLSASRALPGTRLRAVDATEGEREEEAEEERFMES